MGVTYSGTVLLDETDPDSTVMWTCSHQHKTARAAQKCGDAEAERQNAESAARKTQKSSSAADQEGS